MGEERLSVICPGCSCLCDDLDVILQDARPVEVANACLWGVSRFLGAKKFHPKKPRHRLQAPQVRVRGRWETVPYNTALAEAAALLAKARRPLLYGLTNVGCGAQEAALRLARRLKARLEPADLALMAPYFQSLGATGVYGATLEVIRDEADTVLFWGANPLHSCPRHLVRHAVFARGRYTERGAEDRRLAAVDVHDTEMAGLCQVFVSLNPAQELVFLEGLIGAVTQTPVELPKIRGLRKLAAFLHQATFGVIFAGRGAGYGPGREKFQLLARLSAALNRQTPFVFMPLSGDFNATGLYHLLLRELGSPLAPDFADPQAPEFHASPAAMTEVDALLVTGADLFWFLPRDQADDLRRRQTPVVAISPVANHTTVQAQVVLPAALEGVESAEVACRMDGQPVLLTPVAPAAWPATGQVLSDLMAMVAGK